MKFTKMHGLGNDYIYVSLFSEHLENPAETARRMADRHTGVGGDGLILIAPSSRADVRMEMYNADGSRAQMCGNGIRCVAKFAVERGLAAGPVVRVETDAGIKQCECTLERKTVRTVRVDMGPPDLSTAALPASVPAERMIEHPIRILGETFRVTGVSMGNPHAVIFVADLHTVPLVEWGPRLERAPEFPQRINVHFARVDAPNRVVIRTWERGSGATRACGTGACAVCVAGATTGRTDRRLTAALPGGELQIEWAPDSHVYMTGDAVEVFSGDWAD